MLCRVLEVSESGYYAWRKRLQVPPKLRRKTLTELVKNCYFENRRRYGVRRIKADLNKQGHKIGKFQVRKLMKEAGLKAIGVKSFKPQTTDSKGALASPNLLKDIKLEDCAATKVIIGDITYLPMQNGSWSYLAMWQD
jgi:putative transposase